MHTAFQRVGTLNAKPKTLNRLVQVWPVAASSQLDPKGPNLVGGISVRNGGFNKKEGGYFLEVHTMVVAFSGPFWGRSPKAFPI